MLNEIGSTGLKDGFRHLEHRFMGSQLLDLVTQKQADPQRASDDARAVKQQIPRFYPTQQSVWSTLVQIGYCEICFARKCHGWDEQVCTYQQQH